MSLGALIGGIGNAAVGAFARGGALPQGGSANYTATDIYGRPVSVGPSGQISYPGAQQIAAAMLGGDPSAPGPSVAPGKKRKAQAPPDLPMGDYTRMGLDQQGGLADSLLNFGGAQQPADQGGNY